MSVNKAIILGNVGKEPIIRTTEGGSIASLSVATTEKYNDRSGQRQEQTEWHDVVCFGKLADVARDYIRTGAQVYVEGKIRKRSWEDKDGQKHYVTEIHVGAPGTYLQILSGRKEEDRQPQQRRQETRKAAPAPEIDLEPKSDDLPF